MNVPEAALALALREGARLDATITTLTVLAPFRRRERHHRVCLQLQPVCLGLLPVPSGALIVGDLAMHFDMTGPFEQPIAPGTYEVWATIATPPKTGLLSRLLRRENPFGDEPRVAFLTLLLDRTEPTSYVLAKLKKSPDDRPIDAHPGFGIDLAGAAMVDASHVDAICELPMDDLWEVFNHLDHAPEPATGLAGRIDLPTSQPTPAIVSETGWGDGAYCSYWGLDADGACVRLVVDFNLPGNA